jgi:hypothetical protein
MSKSPRLPLSRESLRRLSPRALAGVSGGGKHKNNNNNNNKKNNNANANEVGIETMRATVNGGRRG